MKQLGNQKLGVIGVGNMGASILEGVLAKHLTTHSHVWVYDKAMNKARSFASRYHVGRASSVVELLKKTGTVLLAIKPQDFTAFAIERDNRYPPVSLAGKAPIRA